MKIVFTIIIIIIILMVFVGFYAQRRISGHSIDTPHQIQQTSTDDGCYPDLPSPQLKLKSTEEYKDAYGNPFIRYRLTIVNRSVFPDIIFKSAPHLPPCKKNKNSSRTWIDIYDDSGGCPIYGFCAFSSSKDLDRLWFSVPKGDSPPSYIYIILKDRQCNINYKSNSIILK